MQGCLTKLRILFHCLLDGGQFTVTRSGARLKGSTCSGAAFLRFPTSLCPGAVFGIIYL